MDYTLIIVILVVLYLLRRHFKGPKANQKSMKNKIVIITGASAGIGKENAYELLKQGATVIFACRDENKTMGVINDLKNINNNEPYSIPSMSSITTGEKISQPIERAHFIKCNLSSFKSVKNFVEEFKKKFDRVDILINNAGFLATKFKKTEDGLEDMIQTNHYSHVLLTYLLKDYYKEELRVINVSSLAHAWSNYGKPEKLKEFSNGQYEKEINNPKKIHVAYGNTKLANILFSKFLAEMSLTDPRFRNVRSYSCHPGCVDTEFLKWFYEKNLFFSILYCIGYVFIKFVFKNSNDGAQTQLYLCFEDLSKLVNGGYYKDCFLSPTTDNAKDKEIEKYIMEETMIAILKYL
jgi:retinol dehydrogenase-12